MWVSTELELQPKDLNSLSKGLSLTPELTSNQAFYTLSSEPKLAHASIPLRVKMKDNNLVVASPSPAMCETWGQAVCVGRYQGSNTR